MAASLQNKINAPSQETRWPTETNYMRQGGPGSHQGEGAQEQLPYHEPSSFHPSDDGTAVAVVEASLHRYDAELSCGVAANSPEQNPWILDTEPSEKHHSLKRKRSNASEKIDTERRLQPLKIMAAPHQGSPDLTDPTVEKKEIVINKASPTNTTPLLACPASSASPGRTDVVSKAEHGAGPDTCHNFSESEVPVTKPEVQLKLQDLLTDARMNLEAISNEVISVA